MTLNFLKFQYVTGLYNISDKFNSVFQPSIDFHARFYATADNICEEIFWGKIVCSRRRRILENSF